MSTIYRVWYPLISMDGHQDFSTREAADAFANQKRNDCSFGPYYTIHSWRRVRVEVINGEAVKS